MSKDDKFVLSKGHGVASLYALFCEKGWITKDELLSLRQIDSRLQGHPDRTMMPELIHAGTGALGQGLSIAIGYAHALKLSGSKAKSYCLLGDGELQEGQIWEGFLYAGARRLDNLIVFVDENQFQNEDYVANTLPLNNLYKKFEPFNWSIDIVDAHNTPDLIEGLTRRTRYQELPQLYLCRSVKGKGVSFMEGQAAWHSKVISKEEFDLAMKELA
jgi:transketolase